MAGLSLTHFSASWLFVTLLRPCAILPQAIIKLGNRKKPANWTSADSRPLDSNTFIPRTHFSLDMKINQSYSLLTKIQTFE
jgi:hypothetical protein